MSSSRSDPLRPSDHADGTGYVPADVSAPRLGPVELLRWAWRSVTSMRTALVLLLLLAVAAIPGSLVPQRSADPNGVTQYFGDHPDLAPVLDGLSLFDVYSSPWFSAIYLLLFVSLIGCVIPRAKHHAKALMSRPPRTPARLSRLTDYEKHTVEFGSFAKSDSGAERGAEYGADASTRASDAITLAAEQLRRGGYRVERDDTHGTWSVSAERGYLRETGNLVFHIALVGVLIAVGFGGGFAYTAQRVVVEGTGFVNSLTDYSSFNPGRFVDGTELAPYTVRLDEFQVSYQGFGTNAVGQAGDFAAMITTSAPDGRTTEDAIRVNHPVDLAGDQLYLLGNGYAPTITVRNAAGDVVYRDAKPFLPQDTNMTSLGVIKVTDGMPEQLGMVGFFYPTQDTLQSGAYTSTFPDLINPVLTLNVYAGDLGIDDGTPRSVYTLETGELTQLTGAAVGVDSIELRPGETADLPNGLGTVTFEDDSATSATDAPVKRFASLQVHRDPSAVWVLGFAVLAVLGLLTALFVPRRRMWVKVAARQTAAGPALELEYAGLARGEDPALRAAVAHVAERHLAALREPSGARRDRKNPDVN